MADVRFLTDKKDKRAFDEQLAQLTEEVNTLKENGGTGGGVVTEADPTVPSWAKEANKPTYTAEEVGALPNTTEIPSIEGLASENYVDDAIENIDVLTEEEIAAICSSTVGNLTVVDQDAIAEQVVDTLMEDLPTNQELIDNVVEKVPIVKVPETPKIVDAKTDMTDTTKHYVLDGDIWYYKKVVTDGEVTYPNVFDKSTATINGRLSVSTGAAASATTGSKGCFITDFIELTNWTDLSSYMVRVNFELQSTDIDANEVFFFDSSKALTGTYVHMFKAGTVVTIGDGKTSFDLKQWEAYSSAANAKYVKLRLYKKASGTALTTTDLNDVVITFDAYSVSSGGTESQQWVNSGISYTPTFQTDLIGVLGEGNVVYLSDNLPAGTYTLKHGDGYDVIGTITVQ